MTCGSLCKSLSFSPIGPIYSQQRCRTLHSRLQLHDIAELLALTIFLSPLTIIPILHPHFQLIHLTGPSQPFLPLAQRHLRRKFHHAALYSHRQHEGENSVENQGEEWEESPGKAVGRSVWWFCSVREGFDPDREGYGFVVEEGAEGAVLGHFVLLKFGAEMWWEVL